VDSGSRQIQLLDTCIYSVNQVLQKLLINLFSRFMATQLKRYEVVRQEVLASRD